MNYLNLILVIGLVIVALMHGAVGVFDETLDRGEFALSIACTIVLAASAWQLAGHV